MLQAVDELCSRDPDLAFVVTKHGPPPMWARSPGFATLVRIVLEQQVSLSSAEAAFNRLRARVRRVSAVRLSRLSLLQIMRLGITRQKAGFIRGIAHATTTGQLSLRSLSRADDVTARDALLQFSGIGPWTADIYLIMALRRPDVWPHGDLVLARSLKHLKRLRSDPGSDALRRITATWAPWRSVAARIVWHSYLTERRLGRRARLPGKL